MLLLMTAEPTLRLLRQEVGLLRRRETRRVFDSTVFVGRLGEERDSFVVPARDLPVLDVGLRTDVVASLLERTPATWCTVWRTRPGQPELHDEDLAWLAGTAAAFAMHDRALDGFYAITRYGWLDVRTGASRTWKRLRL
jgi:hypothetical protein